MDPVPHTGGFSHHKPRTPFLLCPKFSFTSKVPLTNDHASGGDVLDSNDIDSERLTALHVPDALASRENVHMEIGRTLLGAGAHRARDLANSDHDAVLGEFEPRFERQLARSALLVAATILATITYQAAVSVCAMGTYKITRVNYPPHRHNYSTSGLDSFMMTRWFLMFNSAGFSVSVAVIIFLLYEFPLKPWPQIAISTMFGSYMCLIVARRSPDEALALLLLSLPPFLLAAVGNTFGFASSHPKLY